MRLVFALIAALLTLTFSNDASAVDVPLTSSYLCRVEAGKSAALVKIGSLKVVKFPTALQKINDSIAAAQANINRVGKSKAKLLAAKSKLDALKAAKKNIQNCKAGKVSGDNQPVATPTPVKNTGSTKVSTTTVVMFGTYVRNGNARCVYLTFQKWADVPGATFNKLTYDRSASNPPTSPVEVQIEAPYNDDYIDQTFDGYLTGIVFNAGTGFHWVRTGRGDTSDYYCTPEGRAEQEPYLQRDQINGFAHKAN